MSNLIATARAGYPVCQWLAETSISRSYLYALPLEQQPRSIKLGRRRIIIETPRGWLKRIAELSAKAA
jgi:hypothetical protein